MRFWTREVALARWVMCSVPRVSDLLTLQYDTKVYKCAWLHAYLPEDTCSLQAIGWTHMEGKK